MNTIFKGIGVTLPTHLIITFLPIKPKPITLCGSGVRAFLYQHPKRMQVKDRSWSYSSLNYRFGFNGMEMDNEVAGEGNVYSTEFRMMDSRLGRWFSTDPVRHEYFSPYNCFDNCPILVKDPSGADGEVDKETGEVNATIYVRFDEDAGLDCEAQNKYMENMKKNIMDNYHQVELSNGTKIDASTVRIVHAPDDMVEGDLGVNDNLVVAGNGYNDVNQYTFDNEISHMGGQRNSIGYFYLKNNADETAHEFGHMLGLSDRYNESFDSDGRMLSPRLTVPLMLKDKGYSPLNNLMSSGVGGGNFTAKQLNIICNRNLSERKYKTAIIIQDQNYSNDGVQSVRVTRIMGITSVTSYGANNEELNGADVGWGWGKRHGGAGQFAYFGTKPWGSLRRYATNPTSVQVSNRSILKKVTNFVKGGH